MNKIKLTEQNVNKMYLDCLNQADLIIENQIIKHQYPLLNSCWLENGFKHVFEKKGIGNMKNFIRGSREE